MTRAHFIQGLPWALALLMTLAACALAGALSQCRRVRASAQAGDARCEVGSP